MIHDASVEVTCDGNNSDCAGSVEVSPPFVYASPSGAGGHYDCGEATINKLVEKHGWLARGDEHFCESCKGEEG